MSSALLNIFPVKLRELFGDVLSEQRGLSELRFRCKEPIILLSGRNESFLHRNGGLTRRVEEAYRISVGEMKEMMEFISNYSVYAYEEELRQGFITIQGGHRIGVCGKAVLSEGKIKTIRNIAFINVRLAKEHKGCATPLLPYLFDGDRMCHTLIVSPPGCGKSTLLRDLIRQVSDGTKGYRGRKVGVVDERSELAACYYGVPQTDIGMRTDVLDGCPKEAGIEMLLRSMSPEVIAVDELGGERETEMVRRAVYCGCSIVATAHGSRSEMAFQIESRIFERYVFLASGAVPGVIEAICDKEGKELVKP